MLELTYATKRLWKKDPGFVGSSWTQTRPLMRSTCTQSQCGCCLELTLVVAHFRRVTIYMHFPRCIGAGVNAMHFEKISEETAWRCHPANSFQTSVIVVPAYKTCPESIFLVSYPLLAELQIFLCQSTTSSNLVTHPVHATTGPSKRRSNYCESWSSSASGKHREGGISGLALRPRTPRPAAVAECP